uniref:Uncharacterized protein n=1 Tax=Oryza sativa subsp. japonica TaxID=39947 RepID=Q84RT1_ORYSJ|nr:hypothetical protein [Oryza sativa Japonica Group]
MFREEQRSSAIGIPCEKVTRVRILGGQLRSTVGIGTKLREELRCCARGPKAAAIGLAWATELGSVVTSRLGSGGKQQQQLGKEESDLGAAADFGEKGN